LNITVKLVCIAYQTTTFPDASLCTSALLLKPKCNER